MLTVITVIHHQLTHAGHLLQGPTRQGRQLFQLTSQADFSLSYLKEDQTALFSSLCFSKPKFSLHLAKELDTMLNQNPSSQALPPCLLLFKSEFFKLCSHRMVASLSARTTVWRCTKVPKSKNQ